MIFFFGIAADLRIKNNWKRLDLSSDSLKRIKNVPVKISHKREITVGYTRLLKLYDNKLYTFGEIASVTLIKILKLLTAKYNELRRAKDQIKGSVDYLTLLQVIYPELSLTTRISKEGTDEFIIEVSLVTLGARRNTPVFYFENIDDLFTRENIPPEATRDILSTVSRQPPLIADNLSATDIIVDLVYALQSDDSWQRKRLLKADYLGASFNSDFVHASMMSGNNEGGGYISVPIDKYFNLLSNQTAQKQQLDLLQFQLQQQQQQQNKRKKNEDEDVSIGSTLKELQKMINGKQREEENKKREQTVSKEELVDIMSKFSDNLKREILSAIPSQDTSPSPEGADEIQASKCRGDEISLKI